MLYFFKGVTISDIVDDFTPHLADTVAGEPLPQGVKTYFFFKIVGIKHTFSKMDAKVRNIMYFCPLFLIKSRKQ